MCQEGCPVHTPIPQIIRMFQEHRLMEAAGDVVSGAKTVVHAVEGAKKAAESMVRYMSMKTAFS